MKESKHSDAKSKAIIFIHGSGEHSYIWKEQLDHLKIDYNLITIDLPSHGKSENITELTLNLYINVIEDLADLLDLKKIILCGHSLGGAIALSYYFKYPEKTDGLILVGTGARLRVSPFILENSRNHYKKYLEYVPLGNFFIKTNEKLKEDLVRQISNMDPEVVYTDFKICDNFDIMDRLELIDLPCLIICGKKDVLTPPKYSQYLNDKIKNSTLVLVQKAGHKVMLEKPNEVNQAIENFIQDYLGVI